MKETTRLDYIETQAPDWHLLQAQYKTPTQTPQWYKLDCVCRNRRHRLQAKKQARAFLQNYWPTPAGCNDARTFGRKKESHFLETLQQKGNGVCQRCSLIYLQLLEDAHGEQIAESAISYWCPVV